MSEPENTSHQGVARDEHGRYLPGGRSPNPGGRTPVVAEVKELARAHTPDAIGTLVTIMRSTKAPAAARVSAAAALLDRAYGRPQQAVAVSATTPLVPASPLRRATNVFEAVECYARMMRGEISADDAIEALSGGAGAEINATASITSLRSIEAPDASVIDKP